jgi:hypothetical protein
MLHIVEFFFMNFPLMHGSTNITFKGKTLLNFAQRHKVSSQITRKRFSAGLIWRRIKIYLKISNFSPKTLYSK